MFYENLKLKRYFPQKKSFFQKNPKIQVTVDLGVIWSGAVSRYFKIACRRKQPRD